MTNRPIPEGAIAVYRRKAQPVEGGHMTWATSRADGKRFVKYRGVRYPVGAVAFAIRTSRQPEGQATSVCDLRGCVAPAHVEDRPGRERLARMLAYLYRTIPTTVHSPERRAS